MAASGHSGHKAFSLVWLKENIDQPCIGMDVLEGLQDHIPYLNRPLQTVARLDTDAKLKDYHLRIRDTVNEVALFGPKGNVLTVDVDDLPECDIILTGPPCQSVSYIGKNNGSTWATDPRTEVMMKVVEIIIHLGRKRGKILLFENLLNLMMAKNEDGDSLADMVLNRLRQGLPHFKIEMRVVDLLVYNVPKSRTFVVAYVRNQTIRFSAA